MTADEAMIRLERKFSSGNDVQVERTMITRQEFEAIQLKLAILEISNSLNRTIIEQANN